MGLCCSGVSAEGSAADSLPFPCIMGSGALASFLWPSADTAQPSVLSPWPAALVLSLVGSATKENLLKVTPELGVPRGEALAGQGQPGSGKDTGLQQAGSNRDQQGIEARDYSHLPDMGTEAVRA